MSSDTLIYGAVSRADLEKVSRAMITRNRGFVKKGRLSRAKTGSTTPLKCDNYFTIELFEDSTGETRFTFEPLDPDDHIYDDIEVEAARGKIDVKKCFNLGFFDNESDEEEAVETKPKASSKSVKSVKSKAEAKKIKEDEAYADIDSEAEVEVEEQPKKAKKRRSLDSDDE
jgi:hypothetical protein